MWRSEFQNRLSPLAYTAGKKRLEELEARLEKRNDQKAMTALTQEWLTLSTELLEQRTLHQNIIQLLEAGASSKNETTAVTECLRMLYSGRRLTHMLRAQSQYLDSSAVTDECHRRRHRLSQLFEYCTRCMLSPTLNEESPSILEKISIIAQEVADQDEQLWPLRESLILLCGYLSQRNTSTAARIRQWLLERAYRTDEIPWITVASLDSWARSNSPSAVEPVLQSLLCSHHTQRTQYGQHWPFVFARFATTAGQHGCWSVLLQACRLHSDSEFVQIEIIRQLIQSSEHAVLDFLCGFICDPTQNQRVRAAAAIFGVEIPDRFFQKRFQAGIQPDMPEWIVETVLMGLAERFREQLPTVSFCQNIVKHCTQSLEYWKQNANRRDLINAAATIQKGATIGRSANLRKAFSELNERWLQNASSIRIRTGPIAELDPKSLAEHLSFYSYNGDDYCVHCNGFQDWENPPKKGYTLQRGWRSSVHLWRVVYEFFHPRPDKRQGYTHLTDRNPVGHIAVVSDRLSEVTPTTVPGQRTATPDSVDWRPELPLPSMLLHAATLSKPILVQTPSSQYLLSAKGTLPRLQSNVSYHELNLLRQRLLQANLDGLEDQYDSHLRKRGFEVERLSVSLPLISLQNIAQNILTVDANSILHLLAFSFGLLFWWVINAITERFRVKQWRRNIPLVIGGWGSRGKSGTERLKAAMIQGMGYSLFAKTTGCEAMMVAGIPGSPPEELFLYRPYDKASITEQRMVLKHAAQFDAQVLLWECMALNPRYVNILQNDWMKDDFTTLTNAYPDHEDIQGPTGLDVAKTITQFIPRRGHVITTEQHMTPILREAARDRNSLLKEQSVLDWRLLGRDVLSLLPYNEHPKNIALVLGLADELGISRDQALWSFAKYVIPDIGVLKSYGPIQIDGRTVSFTNGMSANERAAFLSNWSRSPFSDAPNRDNPIFQVVMFNNRADRLPRQSIFSSIAAMDTQANLMFVIGSNVGSFYDEWLNCLKNELIPSLEELPSDRLPKLIAQKLRVVPHPYHTDHLDVLTNRLRNYDTVNPHSPHQKRHEDIATWVFQLQQNKNWTPAEVHTTLIALLKQQIIQVHDHQISGDSLINLIVSHAPPNSIIRIMGVENIKGTGLDFVYRWLSIEQSLSRISQLNDRESHKVQSVLRELATHQGYGKYDLELVVKTL
ncbi:MAG: hypothetical protein VXZ96_20330, partial [Myxococcota bacterium]|nr:hypothetical protein [Myxococcota bacterium]